jgi:hypothetical protein
MILRHVHPALIAAVSLVGLMVLAGDKTSVDAQMEPMLKKMEAAGTPGAAHKALEPLVGDWNAEVKSWMAPNAPPVVTRATAKARWIMNGRFVQEEFEGEFMGKPFHGMSVTGYDNSKQAYRSIWIDDMNTAIITSEGAAEKNGAVITLSGEYHCPITDEKNKPMKQVIRIINNDRHVLEMQDPTQGENSKTMEITYTRR